MADLHPRKPLPSLARQRNREDGQARRQERLRGLEATCSWTRKSTRCGHERLSENGEVNIVPIKLSSCYCPSFI